MMACSAIIALYLSDYVRPPYHPLPPSFQAIVSTTLKFLSLSIISGATDYWIAASLTALVLVAAALIQLTFVAMRLPHERPRAFGLAAVIMSMMGLAVSVGVSRSGLDPSMGLASRYVTLAAPLPERPVLHLATLCSNAGAKGTPDLLSSGHLPLRAELGSYSQAEGPVPSLDLQAGGTVPEGRHVGISVPRCGVSGSAPRSEPDCELFQDAQVVWISRFQDIFAMIKKPHRLSPSLNQ